MKLLCVCVCVFNVSYNIILFLFTLTTEKNYIIIMSCSSQFHVFMNKLNRISLNTHVYTLYVIIIIIGL